MTISYFIAGVKYKSQRLKYHMIVKPINSVRWKLWKSKPDVETCIETLERLVNNKASICRFGDGEFDLIFGKSIGFQEYSPQMKLRLEEVLYSQHPRIFIGIPAIFGDLQIYCSDGSKWWNEYRMTYFSKLRTLFRYVIKASNAMITRFCTDLDKDYTEIFIPLFKKIWDNRNITIIEGEKSRLGVGNDLFNNATSIKRIIAPAKYAFNYYSTILKTCIELIPSDDVVIIALGPTATILAYDLALQGYQALDLGHIDVQYELHLKGLRTIKPLPGKYVNEAASVGQNPDDSIVDHEYLNSIIARID